MPTQQQIADHLDMDQSAVLRFVDKVQLDYREATLDAIRIAYIRQLREMAAGRASGTGIDLVRVGDWVSDWLKLQAGAAGKVRHWRPPSVDEEVALWAPSGDLTSAFVAPGYYTEQHGGAGRVNPDETATDFPDGAFEQYNHASHEYVLSVPAGRRIVFRIGGTEFELKADGTTLRSAKLLADVQDSMFTGNTTTEQWLAFNGGMQGEPGEGGGVAMNILGGAEYTEDVVAAGKSVSKHRHRERGDGELVGMPV